MKNKALLSTAAALSALALAAPAAAQGVSLSWGATLTSNYVSRGETQSANGAAFQPWVEAEMNGFYAGIWASNVRFAPAAREFEIDLYGGYRWNLENTTLDIGYARYLYSRSGDAGGEFYLLAEHEAGNITLFGGVYVGHTGGWTLNDIHAGVSMPLWDRLSGSVRLGRATSGRYGDIGVSYALSDNIELDARLHHSTAEGRRVVVSANFSF